MRIVSQTEIASREGLMDELSGLLEIKDASLWSVEMELEQDDPDVDCGCGAPGSHPSGPESDPGGEGEGGGQGALCQLVGVRVIIVCRDNGCQRKGGICIGQLVQAPKVRCVCVRRPPKPEHPQG